MRVKRYNSPVIKSVQNREEEEKPCRKEKGGVGGNSTKLASQYLERLDNAYVFHLYTLLSYLNMYGFVYN